MHSVEKRAPIDSDVHVALQLFLALRNSCSATAAHNLIEWLQDNPNHVGALDEALTVWAMAGAALINQRRNHSPTDAMQ